MSNILKGLQLNELSPATLASYKKKAGADATAADKAGDYKRGDKRMSGIVKATKKEFANDAKNIKEDFEDLPDELMDPAVWKKLPDNKKYKALMDAGLVKKLSGYYDDWLNGKYADNPNLKDVFMPSELKNGELDLNKVYRKALAKYQERKHGSDLTAQDREHELAIGTAGRAELIRKADELAEMKRVTLRNERLHDEEVAFQRAETIQQRKDEMQKIADKYKHDLTVIDKEHRNNMEAIRTGNNHDINKLNKEHAEAARVRDWESSERDKDRPKPEKPMPEPEMPRPEYGNNYDQDTGEPIRPNKPQQSNQWHTSQQVGYTPTKPGKKDDDVTDVEPKPPKPNKPLALGNSVKEAGPGVPFRGTAGAFNRGDDERHDLDTPKQQPQIWGLKINGKVWQKNGKYVTFNSKEAALNIRNSILKNRPDLQIGLVTQGGGATQSAAPTKPAPQKPLMAVSMERWKQAVLNRYPEARFATQKMINGATIASDRSGQVGIYDPKNSYAKVGPETKVNEELDENLHKWFQEKWVRFGPDGKIRGACARGDDSEGKPKCLPQSKAQNLGKKGRASAAARKRREDPNPERSGKAINVNTKKKSNESINEGIPSDNSMGSTPSGAKMTLGQWKQMWQKKMPNADMSLFRFPPSMSGSAIAYFDGWVNNPEARWDPQQGVSESEGNFAGDTPFNLGGVSVKKLTIGDIVSYLGQKAKILAMSKTGNTSRIHIPSSMGGVTKDVLTKDLKRTSLSEEELDEACWKGYHKEGNKKMFGKTYPNCVKNEGLEEDDAHEVEQRMIAKIAKYKEHLAHLKKTDPEAYKREMEKHKQTNRIPPVSTFEGHSESCPHCGNEMVSEELMNEKKDACYYKVKSRYKVWPSAYASGALVKCRKKGASNWGTGGKSNESIEEANTSIDASQALQKLKQIAEMRSKFTYHGLQEAGHADIVLNALKACSAFIDHFKNNNQIDYVQNLKKLQTEIIAFKNADAFTTLGQLLQGTLGKINFQQGVAEDQLDEKWSKKYKDSINCSNPKGFSQKAHCAGKQKNESAILQGLNQINEGWKEKLGAAALAGSMALGAGGAHARVTPDGQGGFTGGMKPSATVTSPDNTPSATKPTASSDTTDPFKGLVRADSADRQAKTITVGGKEYRLVEISPTDIRPRGGQQIVVPQAVLGERSIGNYMGILAGNTVFVISK